MSGIQNIQVGAECPIELQLGDGAVDQYPQAYVYDEGSILMLIIPLSHRHEGNYNGTSYNMPTTDYIKVVYVVYSDAGHTTENTNYERAIDIFYRLDPADYKATGFAVPSEYDGALGNIQTEVNGLDGEAMRGTDGANTIAPPDISALALEANVEGHAADALTAYDPPTRGEATADKEAIITHGDGAWTPANVSDLALEATSQSILADTGAMRDIENGKWKMENNQMKFYKHGVGTPFLVFNLFDEHGNPAMTRVTERRRA